MGSPKQQEGAYMAGFRRGVVGLPCKTPATVEGDWDFQDRRAFEDGYKVGLRGARASEAAREEEGRGVIVPFPRVAVVRHKIVKGVNPPGEETSDWREPRGSAGNTRKVRAAFELKTLREAIETTYDTDAHLVSYYLMKDGVPLLRQPRVNKAAVDWVKAQGFELWCDTLWCDVDNPEHSQWTDRLLAEAERQHRELPQGVGYFYTAHGRRFFAVLDEPKPAPDVERFLEVFLRTMQDRGFPVDWACRDWTRLFRCPRVRREREAAA